MGRGKRPATPIEVLASEYAGGASLREIAARHQTTKQNVQQRLIVAGVPRRRRGAVKQPKAEEPPKRPRPLVSTAQLRADYERGMKGTQIARKYGMRAGAVYGRLGRVGVRFRRATWDHVQTATILANFAGGMCVSEIARKFGMTWASVYYRLRRAGVVIRRAPPL